MSALDNYRLMVSNLTAGINFCRSYLGDRLTGTIGLVGDLLAEGTNAAFYNRLPGHPQQAEDALNQQGSDFGLFRYRGESITSWRSRVSNPWPMYEQAGTPVQLLRAINEWGAIVFPATWDPTKVFLQEGYQDQFTIFIKPGVLPWGASWSWGDGSKWGDPDLLFGISNAKAEDIDTLRRIVRKWKRGVSKGTGCIVLSGHVWGEPGLNWGAFNYGPAQTVILGF